MAKWEECEVCYHPEVAVIKVYTGQAWADNCLDPTTLLYILCRDHSHYGGGEVWREANISLLA